MPSDSLKVFAVAADRTLLQQLSKFLQLIGYRVQQSASPAQARLAIEADQPDFLLVDGDLFSDGGRELCRTVCGQDWPRHVHTLLLVDDLEEQRLAEALEAGVDDFLQKPIVFGELLARLRAGARVMERERRLRRQARVDGRTGLDSRVSLERSLREAARSNDVPRRAGFVLLDLDFFGRVNHVYGRPAANEVLRSFAGRLRDFCAEDTECFSLGGDRFGVLLWDVNETQTVEWAERLCRDVAEYEPAVGGETVRLTCSVGVAEFLVVGDALEDAIDQANEALRSAKRSGRNCVAGYSSLGREAQAWAELATPGMLFERTVARDVMNHCTTTLQPDDPVGHAIAMLSQIHLDQAPAVDATGKLLGLASRESLAAATARDARKPVREFLHAEPDVVPEDATFAELMEFFTSKSAPFVVVANQGRPTGFVTRQGLAALSEPLTSDSFATTAQVSSESDYLLVPEMAAAAAV